MEVSEPRKNFFSFFIHTIFLPFNATSTSHSQPMDVAAAVDVHNPSMQQ